MTYASAGLVALIIHLIINYDVLHKKESSSIIPARRYYRAFLVSIAIFYVADACWGFFSGRRLLVPAYVVTLLFFFSLAFSVLCWARFVVEYLEVEGRTGKVIMVLGNALFLFQLVILIINLFRPILFYFDREGLYHPGPVRYINFIAQIVMYVLVALFALFAATEKEDAIGRRYHIIAMFSLIMAGFVTAQAVYPLLPLYALGCLIGCCLLHSFVLENVKEEYRGDLEEQLRESEEKGLKYDQLTGLLNMTYFFDLNRMARESILGSGDVPVMLYMDFAGMKFFNTKYGFSEGDTLLQDFAKILSRIFGTEHSCRISADRFAVVTQEEGLEDKLHQIFHECKYINTGRTLPLHVGIYSDKEGDVPASEACDRAKLACKELSGTYASCYKYYSKELQVDAENRQYIIENIDRAIDEKWIQVYFQPIVRATNRKTCDVEALSRWIDPVKGILSPAEFIPTLEDSGQIYKLDLYVLDEIIKKIQYQNKEKSRAVPNSINLSRSDFDACDIVEEIRRRVDEAGIARDMITIEITESIVGSDPEFIKERVDRFRELGFPVWMDDFGSGYSSLDVLQTIPFDLIKFDMGFLRRLDEGEEGKIILTELMQMATELGVDTICEGVETEEQVRFLQEIGCSKLQGYYFSKPIPLEEVIKRYEQGEEIGREAAEEALYYDAIGKINLSDLASVVNEEDSAVMDTFEMIPMAIFEVKDGKARYVRSNQSYREFMERYFDLDILDAEMDYGGDPDRYGRRFLRVVEHLSGDGIREFFDENLPDGSMAHSFARRLDRNPLTGKTAIAIAVLSISQPGDEATYAQIARALAADYHNIYVVDLDTEDFIAYLSSGENEELAIERHGVDFFEAAKQDTMTQLYEGDREPFLRRFSREYILKEIEENGAFTSTYRLMENGEPIYAHMKAIRLQSGGNRIIFGVSIIDSQMKEREAYERAQQDRIALGRMMALSEGYIVLYSIDPETNRYTEYSSSEDFHELGIAKEGEDFFEQSVKNSDKLITPEDLPHFLEKFKKDKIMRAIRDKGKYIIRYNMIYKDAVIPVSLRFATTQEGERTMLIAGARKESDDQQG